MNDIIELIIGIIIIAIMIIVVGIIVVLVNIKEEIERKDKK